MTLTIRDAASTDTDTIADFNARMAQETENKTLDPALIRRGVAALIADPAKGRYWIAERDGATLGQIMVTWEWSDWRNGWFWWIQSVYVAPEARRSGIFRALYETVKDAAIISGDACGLRLYVERDNRRATETYVALGMHDAGYNILETTLDKKEG